MITRLHYARIYMRPYGQILPRFRYFVSRAPIAESASRRLHDLLADPDIRRWHKDHRSPSTADLQLAQLELFCRRTGVEVHVLSQLGSDQISRKSRRFQDVVSDWVDDMRKAGRPDSYIALNFAAVPKLAQVQRGRAPVEAGTRDPNRYHNRGRAGPDRRGLAPRYWGFRTPVAALQFFCCSPQESVSGCLRIGIRRTVFDTPTSRISMWRPGSSPKFRFSSGSRPSSARRSGDTPHSELGKQPRPWKPTRPNGQAEANGSILRVPVITVDRRAGFGRRRRSADGGVFLTEEGLSTVLKKALTIAIPKNTPRPYVTRAWASTQLLLAESKGLITRDFRESLLGHSLGVAGRYNLDKKWRADLVEEMRDAYRRCEPLLSTTPQAGQGVDAAAMSKMLLMGFGYSEEDLATTDLSDLSAVQDLVAKKMASRADGTSRQKVIGAGELAHYLEDGWTVVVALGFNQVVVNPPPTLRTPLLNGGLRTLGPSGQSFAQ